MLKNLIEDQKKGFDRRLGLIKFGDGCQIQVEQDGQDSYINLSQGETRQLIGELDKLINL